MRKHRKWWMGFGIGIILGASMLQLILAAQDLQKAAEAPRMYTQAELNEAIEKAVQEALKETDAASGADAASDPLPSASPSTQPSPPASVAPGAQTEKTVAFYINPGMDLKTVARSLKRLGIIEDADDFTDEARTIAKEIQPGTSIFPENADYETIIAELVRVKDD